MVVKTGPARDLTLDMDGERGELLEVSGHLVVDLYGFVQLDGNFALAKSTLRDGVTLSDGSNSGEASLLTIGASDVTAFAGLNGGTVDALGLQLAGVDFGLALISSNTDITRSWTSLQASAASAAFVGVDGMTVSADTLNISVNQAGKLDDAVVDYSTGKTELAVKTGPVGELNLSLDGADAEMLSLTGNLDIDLFGFFQVSGGFAIEKRSDLVVLNDATDTTAASAISVNLLTIGGSGIDAFAGINGGTSDALGLALQDVSFGLALMSERPTTPAQGGTAAPVRKFTSLQASAGSVALVGIDGVTLSANSLNVQINRGIAGVGAAKDVVVDYAARQLDVTTGPDTYISLEMDGSLGELTRARGNLELNLFNFFSVSGDFAFDKYDTEVKLSDADGNTVDDAVQVDLLTIGASNVNAFVGMNGARDAQGQLGDDAFGLDLQGANFALALLTDKADPARKWTSIQAGADSLAFVGIEGLTAEGTDILVAINKAAADGSVVDYSLGATELVVATGPDSTLQLDMAGSDGPSLKASAHLTLDMFGFFQVDGDFALSKTVGSVTLSDGSEIERADLLTIGGNSVDVFAGLNGGTDDALGMQIEGVNFALALITDPTQPTYKFTTLQATAAGAGLVGIDSLKVHASDLSLALNRGITLPATAEVVTKTNTKLTLTLPPDTAGTLTLARSSSHIDVTLTGKETESQILQKLTTAFESLSGVGTGKVQVTGNAIDGYTVEFVGTLSGIDVTGITVSLAAPTVGTAINVLTQSQAAVNEVKRLLIETFGSDPVPVTVDITPVTQGVSGKNESNFITFTQPTVSGNYTVFLSANGNVQIDTEAQAGASEVQRLTLDVVGGLPPAVTAVVSQETAASIAASSEIKSIKFLDPYNSRGVYTVTLGAKSVEVRYVGNDITNNKRYIKEAVAELLGTSAKNITVSFDSNFEGNGTSSHVYGIAFVGALANRDIADFTLATTAASLVGKVSLLTNKQGSTASGEVQRVKVSSTGQGEFVLSLSDSGKTYTAQKLAFGATAAAVQTALNTALAGSGATVAVTKAANGDYLVSFGGNLLGKNVAEMTVSATAAASAPGGTFTLTLDGQTTSNITWGDDAVALAKRIQIQLAALSGVGAGNIQVSVDSAHSAGQTTSFEITFKGAKSGLNLPTITAATANLSGVYASTAPVTDGVAFVAQVQGLSIGVHALAVGYSLTLDYAGQTYTTTTITSGMSQAQVQAAVTTAFGRISGAQVMVDAWSANNDYQLRFGGSLAGIDISPVTVTPTVEQVSATGASATGTFVVGNPAQNVANLKAAYAAMLGTSPANISVQHDATSTAGERYQVSFVGALSNIDVADKTFRYTAGQFHYKLVQSGQAPVAEEQRVFVDNSGQAGSFKLSLVQAGTTYTTTAMAFGATAAQVQSALNTALAGLGGAQVQVTGTPAAGYLVTFKGSLLGVNVANLKLTELKVAPEVASGSFTIELDGQMSGAIAYSANATTMAANIQTALQAMTKIGAGNVVVTVDAANSKGAVASYLLSFQGALAGKNVADITAHFGSLNLGEVSPIRVTEGRAAGGQEQAVVFDTVASDAGFTLALTYNGASYTTAQLNLQSTQDEVQAAVTAAFAALAGADVKVSLWTGKELHLSFGGTLAGQTVAKLVVTTQVAAAHTELTVLQAGKSVTTPAVPARTLVVDYAAGKTALTVDTSSDDATAITLNLEGSKGTFTRAQAGRATVALSDYIYISGGFYMEMADTINVDVETGLPVTYPAGMGAALKTGLGKVDGLSADHSRIEGLQVKPLTLSFTDVDVFAGIGPYFIDTNGDGLMNGAEVVNPDRMGVTLDNIDLALVMMDSTLLADPDSVIPKFYALQLDWANPIDLDWDFFKFKIEDLQVQANQGGKWKGATTFSTPYVDFKSSFGDDGYEIPTSGDSVFLKYDRSFVGLSIGHALLNVGNFFQVEGSFAIEKTSGQKVDVVTGLPASGASIAGLASDLATLKTKGYLSGDNSRLTDLPVDILSIGASNVKITIGDVADPLFVLADIDVAFATMKSSVGADPSHIVPTMYAMKAFWASPLNVDWGFMQLKVDDLAVQMNKGGKWRGTELTPFLDFQASFGDEGMSVATGGEPISLDFNRSMLGVSVGHALVKIDDYFHLEGGFAIEKTAGVAVDIVTGFSATDPRGLTALSSLQAKGLVTIGHYDRIENLAMNTFTLGFSDVKLFVGSGPYFVDTDGDGVSDSVDTNAVGLVVDNLDLGLVMYKAADTTLQLPKLWALKATADQVAFTGLDFLTLSAEGVTVSANQGGVWGGSTVKPYVDFVSTYGAAGLSIATGGDPMAIAFNSGYIGVKVAKATLRIDEFVYVQGAFSFEKGQKHRVTVNTGLSVTDLSAATTLAGLAVSDPDARVSSNLSTISNLEVEALTLGMQDVNVFVGYGIPDFDSVKPIKDQAGLLGMALRDVDLALAILTPSAKGLPKFTALKATASEFVVAGGDGIFELSGSNIAVNLNWSSAWQGAPGKQASVDFIQSFGAQGLLVPTGAAPMALKFTDALMEAQVTSALLAVSSFVHVSGDFAFRRGATSLITVKKGLDSTSGIKANAIDIGANNVHAFVGINGPTKDINHDGVVNTLDLGDDAIGFKVTDFDFGLSILTTEFDPLNPLIPKGTKFTALKAHADGIGFVGFGDFVKFDLQDVNVALNQGQNGMVADFTQGGLVPAGRSIQTGSTPIFLDFDSELIEANVGLATASVAGIVTLQGGFAFQKKTLDRIGFNVAGIEVVAPADALIEAGVGVQAFAGYNGPYRSLTLDPVTGLIVKGAPKTDAIGFAIDNLDFVLSMLTPSKASGFAVPGVNFYSLKASADKAGLVGTDPYLTLEGTEIVLRLNGATVNGYPIPSMYVDYTELPKQKLIIPVGTHGTKMTLDYSSNLLGIQINAKLGIFDLFNISHKFDFSFEMPSINLGSIGLPNIALPNFDLLDFKLPTLNLMRFELPSLNSLRFEIPGLTLPSLPNVNWASLLDLPDLNLSLPSLTLPAWSKLVLNWPKLQLQFPNVQFPSLPDFPALSLFGLPDLPDLNLHIPSFDLPSLRALYAAWPNLSLQFPHIAFPALPAFPDLSFGLGFLNGLSLFDMPSFTLPQLRSLIAAWPRIQLDFPTFKLPSLPTLPDLNIFNIPSLNWSAPKIDLSALSNLVLNWPDLKLQFPDIVFPDLDLPDFSLGLPGLGALPSFMPTISLSGLKDLLPELPDVGFFKDAFNFISNLDLSIGFDPNLGAIVLGKISLPNVNLNLGDFVHLHGDFELNLGKTFTGTMYTGLPADLRQLESLLGSTGAAVVDAIKLLGGISADYSRVSDVDFKGLTLGGSNIYAFIGAGTPDFTDKTGSTDPLTNLPRGDGVIDTPFELQHGLTGFGLENLNIGLGIFKAELPDFFKAKNFVSLTAHADQIGTYGFGDVLKLTAKDVTLEVNSGGEVFGGFMRSRADFATSFPAVTGKTGADAVNNKPVGYKVETGNADNPVYLKFGGEDLIGLDIGMAEIQVSEFLSLRGSLAFRKGERFTVDVNPGGLSTLLADFGSGPTIPMQVEAMTLGGANLSGFAGVGGPYRYGVDLVGGVNGGPDGLLDSINTGAIGLVLDDVDFGLAIMTPTAVVQLGANAP